MHTLPKIIDAMPKRIDKKTPPITEIYPMQQDGQIAVVLRQ